MSIVPPRLEGVAIPQAMTLKQAALSFLVQTLSSIACHDLKRYVENCTNASSYGAIDQEYELEVLRIIEARLEEMLEDLSEELKAEALARMEAPHADR